MTTGTFFLRNFNQPGPADVVFSYGPVGMSIFPIKGDWNGDGIDTIGVYDQATGAFFLRNSNSPGPANIVFTYGAAGAGLIPITRSKTARRMSATTRSPSRVTR